MTSTESFFLSSIIGLIVGIIILYNLIATAVRAKKIERNTDYMARVLSEIAKKQGVDNETLDRIAKASG